MEKEPFAAVLPVIVGGLVNKIIEETRVGDDEAFEKLYNSQLYATLETEETKIWTCSVPRLAALYFEEINTGKLELPDY
jgi:hypothetical protein